MPLPKDTRVAFMGTPEFAVPSLKALIDAGYNVVACYCQPPKPIGRGHKVQKMPVHQFAESHNIPVFTPKSLRNEEAQEAFQNLNLDVAVVVAYGLILPKKILDAPRQGCVNVHGSLLPRWRGAAPLHRALLAGDKKTGISIMKMDERLDTGPVILMSPVAISATMTAQELHDQMARLGGEVLVKGLAGYLAGDLIPEDQPDEGVTYARKLSKDEGLLDWNLPAEELLRKVRALNPWPGVWFDYDDYRIKVKEAAASDASGIPGEVLDDHLTIACGEGALRLLQVQRSGKAPMDVEAFLRGNPVPKGTRL